MVSVSVMVWLPLPIKFTITYSNYNDESYCRTDEYFMMLTHVQGGLVQASTQVRANQKKIKPRSVLRGRVLLAPRQTKVGAHRSRHISFHTHVTRGLSYTGLYWVYYHASKDSSGGTLAAGTQGSFANPLAPEDVLVNLQAARHSAQSPAVSGRDREIMLG